MMNYLRLCSILSVFLLMVACGAESMGDQEQDDLDGADNDVLEETPAGASEGQISVGGANTSTWIYGFLSSWAEVIESENEFDFVIQATAGTNAHHPMIDGGQLDLAGGSTPGEYYAEHGEADFEQPYESFNAMLPISQSPGHVFVSEGSDIETYEDLDGAQVGVGARGSPTSYVAEDHIEALGLDVNTTFAEPDEMMNMMRDGRIDAVWYYAGAPWSAVLDLSSQEDIQFLSFSEDEIDVMEEAASYTTHAEITSETYDFLEEDITTPGIVQTVIVSEEMDEDEVYEIVRTTWENWDQIVDITPAAGSVSIEDAVDLQGTLHPGALRYYEEEGVDIPDELR